MGELVAGLRPITGGRPGKMLGRIRHPHNPLVPKMRLIRAPNELPKPPAEDTRFTRVPSWIMGENDRVCDCAVVALANLKKFRTSLLGSPFTVPDQYILKKYTALSGYDPNAGGPDNNPTDTGLNEDDLLQSYVKDGWDVGLPKPDFLDAYASIDPDDKDMIETASYWFGGISLSLALPEACMDAEVWDFGPGQDIAGGHEVGMVGCVEQGPVVISWAGEYQTTWKFLSAYCEEVNPLFDFDFLNARGTAPGGLTKAQLEGYMRQLVAK